MAGDDPEIRPETRALEILIQETLARGGKNKPFIAESVLFLARGHHAFPTGVVQDSLLEPIDKLIWLVIYTCGDVTGTSAVFPSYAELARLANISSTATVSRALTVLRLTRWLSLCARRREVAGQFGGNVYALHDTPLPLVDAVYLDPDYPTLVKKAGRHHHAGVRRVAAAVMALRDADKHENQVVGRSASRIDRAGEAVAGDGARRRYFRFSETVLKTLSNTGAEVTARVREKKTTVAREVIDPQNLKSALCSSNNKTTITKKKKERRFAGVQETLDGLVLPARLEQSQHELAARCLAEIPHDQRQPVLDELAGRIDAEKKGAKPVYDELSFLHTLCVRVNQGKFRANLGLRIRDARDRRRQDAAREHDEAAERTRERQSRTPRPAGESPLAEARRRLGRSPPPTRKAR